jgi:hypothetical protein
MSERRIIVHHVLLVVRGDLDGSRRLYTGALAPLGTWSCTSRRMGCTTAPMSTISTATTSRPCGTRLRQSGARRSTAACRETGGPRSQPISSTASIDSGTVACDAIPAPAIGRDASASTSIVVRKPTTSANAPSAGGPIA